MSPRINGLFPAFRIALSLALLGLAVLAHPASALETGDWPAIRMRLQALGYTPDGDRIGQARRSLHDFLASAGLPDVLGDLKDPALLHTLMADAALPPQGPPELYVPTGFDDEPARVRLSRDGRFAAVASTRIGEDGTVTVFDLRSAMEVAALANIGTAYELIPGRADIVHAVFPSVHVVDMTSGRNRLSVDMLSRTGSGYVISLAPFADGQAVAAVVDDKRASEYLVGIIGLSGSNKWRLLHRVKYEMANGHARVAVSASGRMLAFAGASELALLDVRSGKALLKAALDAGDSTPLDDLHFSLDERTLVFAIGEAPRVAGGVDVRTAKILWRRSTAVAQIVEDAEGQPLILAPEVLDARTGQAPDTEARNLSGIDDDILAHAPGTVIFARHDGLVAADPFKGRAQILANPSNRLKAAFHDKAGKRLLIVDRTQLRSVDLATGAVEPLGSLFELGAVARDARAARFIDAQRLLLITNKRAVLVDLPTWSLMWDVEFNSAPEDMLLRETRMRIVGDELHVLHWPMFGPWKLALARFALATGRRTALWSGTYDFAGPVAPALQGAGFASDDRIIAVDADMRAHLIAVSDGRVIRSFRPRVRPEDINPGDVKNTSQYRTWFDQHGYILTPGSFTSRGDLQIVAGDPRGYGRSVVLSLDPDTGAVTSLHSRLEADAAAETSDGIVHLAGNRAGYAFDRKLRTVLRVLPPMTSPAVLVAEDEKLDRVAVVSSNGGVQVSVRSSGAPLATIFLAGDGHALTVTREGFVSGSESLWRAVGLRVRGTLTVLSPTRLIDLLRPDLVREAFIGDPRGLVARARSSIDLARYTRADAAPVVSVTQLSPSSPRTLKVSAVIKDGGLGIGRIDWRVDGVLVGRDDIREPADELRVERELPVGRQNRQISVAAFDRSLTLASLEAQVPVPRRSEKSESGPRLIVIAVGVNEYEDARLRLRFAASDAKAVGSSLAKGGLGLYSDVIVRVVVDKDVTVAGINRVFDEISPTISTEDTFILFVAGHGITRDGQYYFIPSDFRVTSENSLEEQGIGRKQWEHWLAKIPASRSLLMFDTCESGTMTKDASAILEQAGAARQLALGAGRAVLTASTDDAPAGEGLEGHGIFTHTLLAAFDAADADRDRVIQLTELAGYVDRKLPISSETAFGFRQVPQISLAGQNFAVVNQVAGGTYGPAPERESRPTHVIVVEADVAVAPGLSTIGQRLKPGTTVRVVSVINGWALVARTGADVGYVAEATLRPLK